MIDVLRQTAPLWLAQIPVLLDDAQLAALQPGIAGATHNRMLREMLLALIQLSQQRLLGLVLVDLHPTAVAMLDLLILGTYRSPDVHTNNSASQSLHPLQMLLPELRVHGRCAEPSLLPSESAVLRGQERGPGWY